MEIKVKKGKILVYRVFDVGSEINLEKVEAILSDKKPKERFKLDRKNHKSLIISSAPLSVNLGSCDIKLANQMISAEIVAKVWHFGTVSLCFHLPIIEGTSWEQLIGMASWIEKDEALEDFAKTKASEFQQEISSAIPQLSRWHTNEDYVTYFIQELSGFEGPVISLIDKLDIPSLILAESKEHLSEAMKKNILENRFQYSRDDLVVVDWNSAFVIEPSGSMDVPLVIEFALNQLLEMRFYDDLLDQKLNTLYNDVVGRKKGLFSTRYAELAEVAGQIYLEISEIVENVENAFKTVGDFYLATIFRATSKRFRFDDWQKSINDKLGNLAEVSKLLHSEVNESRNQTMEFIIIILIAIEVIPFIYNLLK